MNILTDAELKFEGTLSPGEEETFSSVAIWDVQFNKMICLRGLLLNLKSLKLNNEEQLAISPISLQMFVPVMFPVISTFSTLKKGQNVDLLLHNPTDEGLWFKIKLLGIRRK